MTRYWPYQPGIELNNAVVDLFFNTRQKLQTQLINKTNYVLYIDILDYFTKYKLLIIILKEFENILLELIELNLNPDHLKEVQYQIFVSLLQKNIHSFLNEIKIESEYLNETYFIFNHIFYSSIIDDLLLEPLLTYLIFGSSAINQDIFIFKDYKTPIQHVIILFENFIIQTSNLIIYCIFNKIKYLPNIIIFLKQYKICNNKYISIRSIALFINKVTVQNFFNTYIHKPKNIYNARYKVWLFSSSGLVEKYIYVLQIQDIKNISEKTYIFILITETLDVIIPQLEKFLLTIGKSIIYILINLIGNSILLIIRIILIYLNHQ